MSPATDRRRVLVISLRRIGDVLLTTPLIRSLRHAWPDAQIDVLAFAGTTGIVKGNPDINRTIAMPARPTFGETAKLVARLWKRYDLAVSTQTGDRPTMFALTSGQTHVGLVNPQQGGLSAVFKRRALGHSTLFSTDIHRVEQMLRIADTLGIPRVAEVVCPAAASAEHITSGRRYAVIHAAPMFRYKQWTAHGWRALADALVQRGLSVVAIRGPDAAERKYLESVWQGITTVHQAAWPETVSLLSGAQVYVGPDTAVSHLAAATGCPTVALFGPMDPRVWGPWPVGGLTTPWRARGKIQRNGNVWIVQNPLPCLPCTFEGCERHIDSYSRCLDELSPDEVLIAVDEALKTPAGPRDEQPVPVRAAGRENIN
jgi:heptosyltransferase III